MIVDFSPLRSIESILPLMSICREESTKYDSLVAIEDNTESAISEWGSSSLSTMFDNDAIWRIPSITAGFQFSIRAESKQVMNEEMMMMLIVMMVMIMNEEMIMIMVMMVMVMMMC